MKKINYLLLVILSIGLFTTSCKKDEAEPTNFFSLNGENLSLTKGFLVEYGSNGDDTYDVDITLSSSEISHNGTNLTGIGDAMYFDLNTTNSTGLKEGTYNLMSNSRADFSMTSAVAGKAFNIATVEGDIFPATAGSVTIAINGSVYTMDFDLTLTNGSNLTGNYSGPLEVY